MKSLIMRIASIGTVFSLAGALLLLAGLRSKTEAQFDPSMVHLHKGAVGPFFGVNLVIAKVTAICTGGTGTVTVMITQTAAQSNSNMNAGTGSGSSPVKCDGLPRTISVPVFDAYNLGQASGTVTLSATSGPANETRTITIGFPVIEGMEQEEGGND